MNSTSSASLRISDADRDQAIAEPRRMPVTPIAIIAIVVAAAIISSHPGLIALIPIVALFVIRRRNAGPA